MMAATFMPMNPFVASLRVNPKILIAIGTSFGVLGAALTT